MDRDRNDTRVVWGDTRIEIGTTRGCYMSDTRIEIGTVRGWYMNVYMDGLVVIRRRLYRNGKQEGSVWLDSWDSELSING